MTKTKQTKYTMNQLKAKSQNLINEGSFYKIPFKGERVILLPCLDGEDHYAPEMHGNHCWQEYVTYTPSVSTSAELDKENKRYIRGVFIDITYWVRPWNVVPVSQIALESTATKIKRLIYD